MWKIDKPSLARAKGKDVRELVADCNDLDDSVKQPLRALYNKYDQQGGTVTDAQLNTISAAQAKAIHDMYPKTYYPQALSYIRSELMSKVFKCPYCGIQEANTLDHYMPESRYGALAVCRMNLVPMCGTCNNLKRTKPYNQFVHCYYQDYPANVDFFKAKVCVRKNRFVVSFDFDSAAIADATLEGKLRYQSTETRLFSRIKKEAMVFISGLCKECEVTTTAGLRSWLSRRLSNYEDTYGLNDWRCAIIRGMLTYPRLDISLFIYNKTNPVRVNAGGA